MRLFTSGINITWTSRVLIDIIWKGDTSTTIKYWSSGTSAKWWVAGSQHFDWDQNFSTCRGGNMFLTLANTGLDMARGQWQTICWYQNGPCSWWCILQYWRKFSIKFKAKHLGTATLVSDRFIVSWRRTLVLKFWEFKKKPSKILLNSYQV